MHIHGEYIIGAVTQGAEALSVRGRQYEAPAGSLLLLHPEEAHANSSIGSTPLSCDLIHIDPSHLTRWLEDLPGSGTLTFARPVENSPALFRLITEAHAKLRADADPLEHEAIFAALIGELAAGQSSRRAAPDASARSDIARAKAFIDAHFTDEIRLAELSAVAGLSPFHFLRAFRKEVGLTPLAYRNQRRITEARRLLRTARPIAEIALDLGFADQSHFTRHFQRTVGISPARYREQ